MGETLIEHAEDGSREAIAETLRAIADQLSRGGELHFELGEETTSVSLAEALAFELDLERESDGGRTEIDLEIDLEWDVPDPRDAPEAEVPTGRDAAIALDAGQDLEDGDDSTGPPEADPIPASLARFQVFRDRADEWRWRLVHRNGNIIATSGEGYTTRRNAEKGMQSVMANAPGAEVTDADADAE